MIPYLNGKDGEAGVFIIAGQTTGLFYTGTIIFDSSVD